MHTTHHIHLSHSLFHTVTSTPRIQLQGDTHALRASSASTHATLSPVGCRRMTLASWTAAARRVWPVALKGVARRLCGAREAEIASYPAALPSIAARKDVIQTGASQRRQMGPRTQEEKVDVLHVRLHDRPILCNAGLGQRGVVGDGRHACEGDVGLHRVKGEEEGGPHGCVGQNPAPHC